MKTDIQIPENVETSELLINLHTRNKQWLSEINFTDDEIKFMTDLLDKFFIKLIKDDQVNRVQLIKMQLISVGFIRNNIKQDILRNEEHIEQKINNLSPKSEAFLELETSRLADEMKDLQKIFKKVKVEIFAITKQLLQHQHEFEH